MKKNLNTEVDDTWRRKGHLHTGHDFKPRVCDACNGEGMIQQRNGTLIECFKCEGEGVVYD